MRRQAARTAVILLPLLAACGGPGAIRPPTTTPIATRTAAAAAPTPAAPGESTSPRSGQTTAPTPSAGATASIATCTGRQPGLATVVLVANAEQRLYDVTDPLHPRLLCAVKASVHLFTEDTFLYLRRVSATRTDIVQRSIAGGGENDVAGFPVGATTGSWLPDGSELAYLDQGQPDSSGTPSAEVWLYANRTATPLFSYPIPGVDAFGRPGLPPPTLALSPDGAFLVAGRPLGRQPQPLRLFRTGDRGEVAVAMPADARFAVWGRTGHTLYVVGSNTMSVWTAESGLRTLPGSSPWQMSPSFSPDGSQVAYTTMTASGARVYLYDLATAATRGLSVQPRSAAQFVKSGWLWMLEEIPCPPPSSPNQTCFDPTQPTQHVLALNLGNGQESTVTFAAGESPFADGSTGLASGDLWPLGGP